MMHIFEILYKAEYIVAIVIKRFAWILDVNAVITLVGDGLYSENPSKFTKSRMIKGDVWYCCSILKPDIECWRFDLKKSPGKKKVSEILKKWYRNIKLFILSRITQ